MNAELPDFDLDAAAKSPDSGDEMVHPEPFEDATPTDSREIQDPPGDNLDLTQANFPGVQLAET